MRFKSRASRARVSKIPSTPSPVIAQVLNETANFNGVDSSGCDVLDTNTSAERLDQASSVKRLKMTANGDGIREDTRVDERENGNEPSAVPEAPCSSCGFHTNAAPVLNGKATLHGGGFSFLSNSDILNWDCPEALEWTEEGLCIKCNKGGDVLICSNGDCPLAVHECCLGYSPSFDETGNFYCPICSYKRALAECEKMEKEVALAKEKANLARDSFSVFVNGPCPKQTTQTKERNQLEVAEDGNKNLQREISGKQLSVAAKDQEEAVDTGGSINENSRVLRSMVNEGDEVSLTRGDQAKEVGSSEQKGVEDQPESVSASEFIDKSCASERNDVVGEVGKHSKHVEGPPNKSVADQQEVIAAVECTNVNFGVETASLLSQRNGISKVRGYHAKQVDHCHSDTMIENQQQVEVPVSSDSKSSDSREDTTLISDLRKTKKERHKIETFQEHQYINNAKERFSSEARVEFETCRDADTNINCADCRTEEGAAEPTKSVDSSENSSEQIMDSVETARIRNQKKTTKRKSVRNYKSAKRSTNPAIPYSRRKKLPWTHEEEEMLKKAVEKFSSDSRKNLSWRSILDFGSHVFNESRTPVDLKDKWRNMTK